MSTIDSSSKEQSQISSEGGFVGLDDVEPHSNSHHQLSENSLYEKKTATISEDTKNEQKEQEFIKNPNKSWLLIPLIQTGFGLFFAYDAPGALAPALKNNLGYSDTQIGLFYSAYSVSAIWLVFFGGFLLEKFGVKKLLILCTTLTSIGTAILSVGPNIYVMLFGQVLFGLGGANIYMCIISTMGTWFDGDKKKAAKVTITMCLSTFWYRVTSFVSFVILPVIANRTGYRVGLGISCISCVLSLISAVIFSIFFKKYGKEPIPQTEKISIQHKLIIQWKSLTSFVKSSSLEFWCVFIITVLVTSGVFTFTGLATTFMEEYRGFTDEQAGLITSYSRIASAICSLVLAFLIGFIGKRTYFFLFGNVGLLVAWILFAFTRYSPSFLLVLVGTSHAVLDSVCFPSLPLIVKAESLGKTNSFIIFTYNVALFILPVVVGRLSDNISNTAGLAVFVAIGILSMIFSIVLKAADVKAGGILDVR